MYDEQYLQVYFLPFWTVDWKGPKSKVWSLHRASMQPAVRFLACSHPERTHRLEERTWSSFGPARLENMAGGRLIKETVELNIFFDHSNLSRIEYKDIE
jgi:hypothetical protein